MRVPPSGTVVVQFFAVLPNRIAPNVTHIDEFVECVRKKHNVLCTISNSIYESMPSGVWVERLDVRLIPHQSFSFEIV